MEKSPSTKATALILAVFLSAAFSIGAVSPSEGLGLGSVGGAISSASSAVGGTVSGGVNMVQQSINMAQEAAKKAKEAAEKKAREVAKKAKEAAEKKAREVARKAKQAAEKGIKTAYNVGIKDLKCRAGAMDNAGKHANCSASTLGRIVYEGAKTAGKAGYAGYKVANKVGNTAYQAAKPGVNKVGQKAQQAFNISKKVGKGVVKTGKTAYQTAKTVAKATNLKCHAQAMDDASAHAKCTASTATKAAKKGIQLYKKNKDKFPSKEIIKAGGRIRKDIGNGVQKVGGSVKKFVTPRRGSIGRTSSQVKIGSQGITSRQATTRANR